MQEHLKEISDIDIAGICAGFGGLCGMLSYLLKVEEGKIFRWHELVLHSAISAVCGLCTYEVLAWYGMPPAVAGALCGMSGWMGTRFIRIVELMWIKRTGISKDDLK